VNRQRVMFLAMRGFGQRMSGCCRRVEFCHGQIVGLSFSCDTGIARAVLWEEGAIIDLNTLVPADTNLSLADAFNINERGEILCQCLPPGVQIQNGDFGGHDCLLIPSGKDNE
jgi:hypothetical protein